MKKLLLLLVFAFSYTLSSAQCDELFFSGYVEGFGNNKAIEIYNPTSSAVDLSGYSVGRFRNGATTFTGLQLPADMIQPYETYVIVIDKRNPMGTGNEKPVWDGFIDWDVVTDDITGDTIWIGNDPANGPLIGVQYDADACPIYSAEYKDWLDLQGKADVFLNPVYMVATSAMYFNGDDAVALISGTSVLPDGSNLIDVIGVIGDPAMADGGAGDGIGWTDYNGGFITKDRTLKRNANIQSGTGPVVFALGDTLAYADWTVFSKNEFNVLESHGCSCDPGFVGTNNPINEVNVNVFPNPVSGDIINIEAGENILGFELINMVGQTMIKEELDQIGVQHQIQLNKNYTGVYFLNLFFEGNKRSVRKIIINR